MATYRGIHIDSVHYDRRSDRYELYSSDGEIVAEMKRVEFLSQPQLRTLRQSNGRHRKAHSQVYSRASRQSGVTIDWRTFNLAGPGYAGVTATFNDAEPEPAIEHAGIRAGEVVGLRAWRVEGDRLFSVYIKRAEWLPGESLRGRSRDTRNEGVHAWKSPADVARYVSHKRIETTVLGAFDIDINDDGSVSFRKRAQEILAIGTVALWGEIVEHERGYRAEFAKIASLDRIDVIGAADKPAILERLRARYGVNGTDHGSAP